ncbi:arabinan endo-1,5-alpha-L-arabinosidase [Actinokineospora sp. UTMC 2448]|uniref:arabinan endo-1,5-alpha-L-arabinosidase n=1 Tax=Actinokineospora sp. UTMC 2448 TaxID=2268449 RepID=UPI0021645AC0|nr:arabinan endo-1,5-alpha-L-arabinosidase [Actinokineospora sp. UTMC 2448]UVS80685.1 Intracellular endo-alpha-(1->5)-L-arabinanase [Actinokineospora sp. UTMC 2448]
MVVRVAAVALALVAGTAGVAHGVDYPDPAAVTGDVSVHDPTVVKTPSGAYLLAHTGANILLKTSADRVAFQNAGQVFPDGAPWTEPYTGGGNILWAPHLSYLNERFYLYYSASTLGSRKSAIFLATSPTGEAGTWTDAGLVVETDDADDYNAIDPDLTVDDDGRWWLTFGSYWSGIKQIAIDPDTGKPLDSAILDLASRGGDAIEAATIAKHGSYYYLYVSFDRCCQGANSTYRVMVGRSDSINGPYVDRAGVPMLDGGGTEIVASHGAIHGPGHQDVLTDGDTDILVYHYYADNGTPLLGINPLAYDAEGWPALQSAARMV